MPDDNDTFIEGGSSANSPDPLGIIGWVIGGKYKVESYISGGGFGEVYAGYNEHLTEQKVVIKFFKRVQSREKFDKEAKILCQLEHPNICRVIDYLPDEGAAIVAFIDGKDGSQILKSSGALPEKLYLNVARSMTKAIAYAHSKKFAHRDIKPGNILIDKNEHVYLIDFGIAKEIGGDATKTAYTALTPMFAAPERQTGDKNYNPFVSDIYETGITLFNFATNTLPYRNPVNPIYSEWGGKVADKLSPGLRRILLKATHPDPKKRYGSMSDMAEDMDEIGSAYGGKKRFPIKSFMVVLIIALLAVAYWQYGDVILSQFSSNTQMTEQTESLSTEGGQTDDNLSENDGAEETKESIPPPDENFEQSEPPETGQTASNDSQDALQQPTTQTNEVKPAEPSPMSRLLVQVVPANNLSITIDGKDWKSGRRAQIKTGRHELTAMHPDYPLYSKRLNLSKGVENITIDLAEEFGDLEPIDLQLALSPPSDNQILEISFNGKSRTIMGFPVFDLSQPPGEWMVTLNWKAFGTEQKNESARIDSCVTFPYGGGPRNIIHGNKGVLKIGSDSQEKISSMPIVVYWSEL